ncbi:MAG: L-seryl-tRNA(Sec) selenium transferase [Caulobacteraceae bacterium]|nr:L-seryl-tRNA(Sec) selenium transferase [Caulobacteraceae bacterium]
MSPDGQGGGPSGATAWRLRALPQVQKLLETPEVQALLKAHPHAAVVEALRAALGAARADLRSGAEPPDAQTLARRAGDALAEGARPYLGRVINATGVILHTNLGRAPLPAAALEAMARAGLGYSNLEFDLDAGARGARAAGVEPLLRELTGAEAALAVNNAAAAVLLALSGLAAGGEVIVSRGEMVEIGGGFRIPEVVAQGGARLVEVGTTNKTRLDDYRAAISERTRVLLKVHQSNYRIVGFTAEASLAELSSLARERGLLLMHDLGSGALADLGRLGRTPEPRPQDSLLAGADLVAFSGDKLMGGPQAGLLVGRAAALDPLRRHPLMRALRLDKATLAGLEATFRLYRDPVRAVAEIPVLRMLAQSADQVAARAERLGDLLERAAPFEIRSSEAQVGGGSLPGEALASWAVALGETDARAESLGVRFRRGETPVIGRLSGGRLLLDLFTVADEEVEALATAVRAAIHLDSPG